MQLVDLMFNGISVRELVVTVCVHFGTLYVEMSDQPGDKDSSIKL